ncbi:MAG: RecB-family nuclease [Candidatus Thorarchaeota archaeon]
MTDIKKNLFVVLHNVHSVSRVVETAQVVYGLDYQNFIVTRAEGSAAQSGVPDANRLAMKLNHNFMVLPDLKDALELLQIEKPIMIVSPVLTKERLDLAALENRARSGEKIIIALSGSNSSFSRKEMDLGECYSIDAAIDIGPAGTAAIILHALK